MIKVATTLSIRVECFICFVVNPPDECCLFAFASSLGIIDLVAALTSHVNPRFLSLSLAKAALPWSKMFVVDISSLQFDVDSHLFGCLNFVPLSSLFD